MEQKKIKYSSFMALLLTVCLLLTGCTRLEQLEILGEDRLTMEVGDTLTLITNAPPGFADKLEWSASVSCATVDQSGNVTAKTVGKVIITVVCGRLYDNVLIEVVAPSAEDDGLDRENFYEDYTVADSREEALERSELGLLSGHLTVPDQAPAVSPYRPQINGVLIRNGDPYYADEHTYVVVDAFGEEILRLYRGGGYITLEEVAAYVYAFGEVPANYVEGKNAEPEDSIWGEHLRLNHTKFSGNTAKYPYEPVLPDIIGCGGELYYYEIDIGTTGTDCDPHYAARIYNDGETITRGAARLVYTRYDANGDRILDPNEKYVFYTYNHYNDFQEYLNYYGGWGDMFGNITGGGTLSSKEHYAPTDYIPVIVAPLPTDTARPQEIFLWFDPRDLLLAWQSIML